MDNEYLQAMTDDTALTVSLKSDWLFGNVSDLREHLNGMPMVYYVTFGRHERASRFLSTTS